MQSGSCNMSPHFSFIRSPTCFGVFLFKQTPLYASSSVFLCVTGSGHALEDFWIIRIKLSVAWRVTAVHCMFIFCIQSGFLFLFFLKCNILLPLPSSLCVVFFCVFWSLFFFFFKSFHCRQSQPSHTIADQSCRYNPTSWQSVLSPTQRFHVHFLSHAYSDCQLAAMIFSITVLEHSMYVM